MAFLSVDDPEMIVQLITAYPEFKQLYMEVYKMCRNMEDFMGIFSEELAILDKNTVDYMIDEMQNTIDEQKGLLDEQRGVIDNLKDKLEKQQIYQENLNRLNQKLISDNRVNDLARAANNSEFQKELLLEYGLL